MKLEALIFYLQYQLTPAVAESKLKKKQNVYICDLASKYTVNNKNKDAIIINVAVVVVGFASRYAVSRHFFTAITPASRIGGVLVVVAASDDHHRTGVGCMPSETSK